MATLKVKYDVISVVEPLKSWSTIRFYQDDPSSLREILHDLMILIRMATTFGVGYAKLNVYNSRGANINDMIGIDSFLDCANTLMSKFDANQIMDDDLLERISDKILETRRPTKGDN